MTKIFRKKKESSTPAQVLQSISEQFAKVAKVEKQEPKESYDQVFFKNKAQGNALHIK